MAVINTRTEGNVLVVELGRPDQGNALNHELQLALAETWRAFEAADDQVVAVIHGSSAVFSIGHDVAELAHGEGAAANPVPVEGALPLGLSKPVIAAVEGPCYGLAFELALSCDLRVASDTARFGFPDRNLQVPYRVASVLLPRITFMGDSLSLVFTGEVFEATRARNARIVNELVVRGEAARTAIELAQALAGRRDRFGAFRKPEIWQLSGLPLPHAMAVAREPDPVVR